MPAFASNIAARTGFCALRVLLLLTLSIFIVHAASPQVGKDSTLTGEIVDLSCYVKMSAMGMDHAECAVGCAKAGMPLALLEDTTSRIYLLVSDKELESVNGKLQPLEKTVARKSVTIKGRVYEKGGLLLLEVLSMGKGK